MAERNALQFAKELARVAHDHKAEDIVALDLRGRTSLTDFLIITTGTSDRQMNAVAERVIEYARKVGERPFGVHGVGGDSWILIDFVDVVVHVFARPYREYYDLELLWGDAPAVDWVRSESA